MRYIALVAGRGAMPTAGAGGDDRPLRDPAAADAAAQLAVTLTVPALPPGYVPRRRLTAFLDESAGCPVTLVAAPAGWGKTVLLSEWARTTTASVAWLGLDPAAEPRLWDYVAAALRAAGVPDAPPPGIADGSVRWLATWRAAAGAPVTLVVDDFHLVRDPAILAEVEALVRHPAGRLRFVLGCRSDPALPLHRWRVGGTMAEVRAAELSFTPAETQALLAAHGVRLGEPALAELHTLTEGWPAGVRLAALSMRGRPRPDTVVADFATHDRVLGDYLVGEVIAQLDPAVREVLLCTSVLDQIHPGLVAALTGRADGARILADLERTTGFVTHGAGARGWYRYHPLFRQLLRTELEHNLPDRVPDLHRRAALWLAHRGPPASAVRHALAAGEWALAVEVIDAHWTDLIPGNRGRSLESRHPPPDLVRSDPRLALAFAVDRLDANDVEASSAFVRLADRASHADPAVVPDGAAGRTIAMIVGFQLAEAWRRGDADQLLATAEQLLATRQVPDADPEATAVATVAAGVAHLYRADFRRAEPTLRDGLALARATGPVQAQLVALSQLAVLDAALGRLRAADRAGGHALAFADAHGWPGAAERAWAHLALAQAAFDRSDLAGADALLHRTAATPGQADPLAGVAATLLRIRLRQAAGDTAGACLLLRDLRLDLAELADLVLPPLFREPLTLVEAELAAGRGDRSTARRLLAEAGPAAPAAWTATISARLALADRKPAVAAALTASYAAVAADSALGGAPASDSLVTIVAATRVHAQALHQLGDRRRAEEVRGIADRIAIEEGIPPALDGADPGAPGLPAADGASSPPPAEPRATPPIEPLTAREVTVLRYLQSRMSRPQIAAEMGVSVNTVKTHVKNIYRKLDAELRADAVRRARQAGVL